MSVNYRPDFCLKQNQSYEIHLHQHSLHLYNENRVHFPLEKESLLNDHLKRFLNNKVIEPLSEPAMEIY